MTTTGQTDSAAIPEQVLVALRSDDWAWLRTTVRRRLERDSYAHTVLIDTDTLTPAERGTLAWLLGWQADRHGHVRIPLARVDQALATRLTHGHGLAETLEILDGPLADRRAETAQRRAAAAALWTSAAAHAAITVHPSLATWLEAIRRGSTLPAEPGRRSELLHAALDVLAALPATGIGIGTLAANVLGAAHRLDPGPLRRLIVRGLAHLAGIDKPPVESADVRNLWEAFGVTLDPYSSDVLVLGLHPPGQTPLATALTAFREAGTAARITLDQLDRHPGGLSSDPVVFACENPSVLAAAAEQLGPASPPLVCVEGWPSTAGRQLITRLVADNVRVYYHGDYDWPGLEITQLMTTLGAQPWSMNATQYRQTTNALRTCLQLPALGSTPPITDYQWAPGLVRSMAEHGLALEEEHVINELVDLLAHHQHGRPKTR